LIRRLVSFVSFVRGPPSTAAIIATAATLTAFDASTDLTATRFSFSAPSFFSCFSSSFFPPFFFVFFFFFSFLAFSVPASVSFEASTIII
jgi:hypothetical protein